MSTLVFDIETIGDNWEELDETTQKILTRWVDKTTKDEAEHFSLVEDIKNGLGFSPFTGRVVAIGVYDIERAQGAVYYSGEGTEDNEKDGDYTLKQRSEVDMLADFWEGAKGYDTFVTYNGRGFDVPFLMHRSAVSKIKPTVNMMEGRYPYQQKSCRHVDLQDEMTFFGAMYRKPSLHLCCRAYGIESPKMAGVSGDDVAELFLQKKFRDIARYNARDVIATTALYKKWQTYFAPLPVDETIDF
ncbi:3'-5' exonuclease [Candidatus Kaiserbacteria bacterium CG_4_8_14_3_um_filter_38_9]|uniref:3'-5' exonuclease n=1 Tax=Candidatus Kaiserbacteria bacterium CG_4_8_14_3_um_filter_38_9 TaxID=1974599 RepID=A0A2M7INT9_9BACT|nr:MAG: 3'-5' exonuclease [Candidatus Kaiserbacteria bacterium CG_4_8_14_3_um_filter_38_9]